MGYRPDLKFSQKDGNSYRPIKLDENAGRINEKTEKNILRFNEFCYAITGLPAGEYALTYVYHEWSIGNMKFDANLVFNPEQSFSAMPIRIQPGKINYLGIFEISYSEGIINLPDATLKEVTDYNVNENYNDYFYPFKSEPSKLNGEKDFLGFLQALHKEDEGYWKNLINHRLSQLNK